MGININIIYIYWLIEILHFKHFELSSVLECWNVYTKKNGILQLIRAVLASSRLPIVSDSSFW